VIVLDRTSVQEKNGGLQVLKKNVKSNLSTTASGTLRATVNKHFDDESYNTEVRCVTTAASAASGERRLPKRKSC